MVDRVNVSTGGKFVINVVPFGVTTGVAPPLVMLPLASMDTGTVMIEHGGSAGTVGVELKYHDR